VLPHHGKCPKCAKVVDRAIIGIIDIDAAKIFPETTYKGMTFSCPWCETVIAVTMDQIALNADLVSRLFRAVGKV
jgi:predicted Zn finger-like uncharacterized protein